MMACALGPWPLLGSLAGAWFLTPGWEAERLQAVSNTDQVEPDQPNGVLWEPTSRAVPREKLSKSWSAPVVLRHFLLFTAKAGER